MARRASKTAALLLALLALGAAVYNKYLRNPQSRPLDTAPPGAVVSENHFSPAENLEQLDLDRLERAQRSVDIAMYAFTDKYIAEALARLARRGVRVRLYRDRSQYVSEQQNAAQHRDLSTTDLLRREPNLEIRIKAGNRRDLMHLKSYLVDDAVLRDGSANWSPSGLKRQDNNAHFTNDPVPVRAFRERFEEMWDDPDNEVVK